ncbi:hypothetical protein [Engelhardtia mirabilis]|uniref:Chromosome partition protein Smc n=1 Tax=Engelhardtia mirabilis TaxID=2528011 RepID=A0A518BRS8_9BACT|nr:hypothetical protein Pla133_47980 [Planctomycetes bacterium Pla133]QDV04003.1 hypothetical protein Pla86_47960 [Planctomycetes bacterium Pla86]
MKLNAAALCLTLAATCACHSPGSGAGAGPGRAPSGSALDGPVVEFDSAGELRTWVTAGLRSRRVDRTCDQLGYWVEEEVYRDRAAFAAGLFDAAGVESLFLSRGGQTHLAVVKELRKTLGRRADAEVDELYSALDGLDTAPIQAAMERPGAVLHPDTVALLPDLGVHRRFFTAVLDYARLSQQGQPSAALASEVARSMDQARMGLAAAGADEPFFLAAVFSAQALELVGADEAAVEYWLAAADSAWWDRTPADLQAIIGSRVVSYRQRVHDEIEADLTAKWEGKYSEALARIDSLEGDLAVISDELLQAQLELADEQRVNTHLSRSVDLAQQLAEERRARFDAASDELEGYASYVSFLERELARTHRSLDQLGDDEPGLDAIEDSIGFIDMLSFAADVITIRGLLRRGALSAAG